MRLYHDPYSKAFTKNVSVPPSKPRLHNKKVLRNATNIQRNTTKTQPLSDAVNKRLKELEQLRRRTLTKDIATRLQNAEAPSESNLGIFAERQREKVRLEKEKLREAKSYLNNYRADGNKLSKFTESRRKSLEQEKAELEKARKYMKNYHGVKLDAFAERRRKSLLLERSKVKEARDYMNSYRGDGNIPISSRRKSTGSKAAQGVSNSNHPMTPKQLFSPMGERNPQETPNLWAPRSARKDKKDNFKTTSDESREPCSNRKTPSLRKKRATKSRSIAKNPACIRKTDIDEYREQCSNDSTQSLKCCLDCRHPPSFTLLNKNKTNISEGKAASEGETHLIGAESNIWNNASQHEYLFYVDAPRRKPNTCDHVDPHWDFLAILLGLDSTVRSDLNDEYKIFFDVGNKDSFVPSNQQFSPVFNENDPYTNRNDKCAHMCERIKDKECFGWTIM